MNAPLTANAHASEPRGIDKLFAQMAGMYGSKFADLWAGVDPEQVKKVWIAGLSGLSGQEIAAGMDACLSRNFPPTLPEFRNLCRPPLDTQALMHVAMRELANRKNRQPENWPNNRLFWAAQRIAYELRTCEKPEKLLKRFELAWFEAANDADKPIPNVEPGSALPAPGGTTLSQAEAKERAQQIGLSMGRTDNTRGWAFDIAKDPKRYGVASIEAAIKALKVFGAEISSPLIERAKALGLGDLVEKEGATS